MKKTLNGSISFDWPAARSEIERETASFQRESAFVTAVLGSCFPLAFITCDLFRGVRQSGAYFLIPFVILVILAVALRLRPFDGLSKALVMAGLVAGYALSVTLPNTRDVYIVILFCFPSMAFLVLGAARALVACALFFVASFGSLPFMLRSGAFENLGSFRATTYAMAAVSFALQCVIGAASESRHAKNVDRIVSRRFFDDGTGLPNVDALAMEGLSEGDYMLIAHIDNMRDLRTLADRDEQSALALKVAAELRARGEAGSSRRGPFRVSEADFCLLLPTGARIDDEANAVHAAFARTPAIRDTPLRFVTNVVSYRSETGRTATEALDLAMAALSDCLATKAATLHRSGDPESLSPRSLKNAAPTLLRNIERALFKPAFQPVYDLERDGVGFLEALIRFDDDGSPVSPERYLDAAFRLGLDRYLTEFILERALAMALESGHSVSFNATYRDIARPAFRSALADAYRGLAGRANTIIVELTEQAAVEDTPTLMGFVREVHEAGGLVFLDDFGSGYSNYASLLESRFDAAKAAGNIVREIAVRPEAYTLYRGMAAFCAEAGLSVVAEHISDDAILDLAVRGGARYLQGYLLSRPVTAEAILGGGLSFPRGFRSDPTPIGA